MVGGWRFVYIFFVYVGSGHFFVCVFEIWKCNIVLYYQKSFFLDVKMLWLSFLGLFVKLDFIYGSFLCILGPFLKVKLLNGGIFCVGEIKKNWGGGGGGDA